MEKDVAIWAALADGKRRQIITLLEEKPRTTSELSNYFEVSRFAVMKHLKVLEEANLIRVERKGRERWNFLNAELAQFLRTKLAGEEDSSRLVQLLDLFPGSRPAAGAYLIEEEVSIEATADRVFQALTVGIDCWWSQRKSADSQMKLEPWLNGRFYESFDAADQGILYGLITTLQPNQELRLRGTLEFGQQIAGSAFLDNDLHIMLHSEETVTHLALIHRLERGVQSGRDDRLDAAWGQLLQQLKLYIEQGIVTQKNENGAGG